MAMAARRADVPPHVGLDELDHLANLYLAPTIALPNV